MAEKKEEAQEAPKGGKKKLVIIVAVAVLVIGGGVGAFLAMGSSKPAEGEEGLEEGAEGEHGGGGGEHGEGGANAVLPPAVLPLETFIVNLQVKGSFLRTTIQLEFAESELPHTIENDTPKIKDAVIKVLSAKSSSELLTSEGKEKIKTEVRDSVNEILGGEEVTQVYFTEFIIQ
jgi:flagellar FliL protein